MITFQSRIVKPDGVPLEAASVNFRISITDTVGSCVIYQEDFSNRNMSGNKGLINLAVGTGSKIFPVAAMTLSEVFNNYNSPTLNCQAGGNIIAGATDRRKMIVQFNDGSGWQTVPAMDINSTPFSLQAVSSQRLGDFPAADYLRTAIFPTCVGGEALHFNGASFTCVAVAGGAGTVTNVSSANADISVATGGTTPVLTLNAATTGADKILRLKNDGTLDAISGVNLTNLNATALASGTVTAGRMPALTGEVTTVAGNVATTIAANAITSAKILDDEIVDADIKTTAAITRTKLATGSANHVLVNDGITGAMSSMGCNNGELIKWAAGVPSCSTDIAGVGDIINGGNTTGAAVVIGTNDAQSLQFETNNAPAMTILSSGRVGIGTTTPAGTLDVRGGTAAAATNGTTINLIAQTAGAGNQNGGGLNLTAGSGTGTGAGGAIAVDGGFGQNGGSVIMKGGIGTGTPGSVQIIGGNSFSSANGGMAAVQGGWGNLTGNGGAVTVLGGTGGSTSGSGGAVSITGGSPWGGGSGGTVNITGNDAIAGNNNGGNVVIRAGTATGAGTVGSVQFTQGNVGIGTTSPTSKLHTVAAGAKTAGYTGNFLSNTATSGTAAIAKVGLDVQSTGVWNGAAATNTGLNVNVSGGTTNYAATFQGGNVGIGTTGPNAMLDINQTVAGSAAFLAESGGSNFFKILNPAGGITTTYNAADSVLYVGSDTVTGRSINVSGTINAAGADFAEWVDWPSDSPAPQMGSVVLFKGGYVVVSSPSTAAFIGNDNNKFKNPVLVAFAGQLPVLVTGKVSEGDLIVAQGDGTALALPKDQVTMAQARNGVGTAWASSDYTSLKRVNVAVGIGLGGNGARDIATVNAKIQKLEFENAELKARLDQQHAEHRKEFAAIKRKLGL